MPLEKMTRESPRTRMHYVYSIVTRVCQRVLRHKLLPMSLVNDSCQGQESATF